VLLQYGDVIGYILQEYSHFNRLGGTWKHANPLSNICLYHIIHTSHGWALNTSIWPQLSFPSHYTLFVVLGFTRVD
jgi:predicted Na+-dependent transporter